MNECLGTGEITRPAAVSLGVGGRFCGDAITVCAEELVAVAEDVSLLNGGGESRVVNAGSSMVCIVTPPAGLIKLSSSSSSST